MGHFEIKDKFYMDGEPVQIISGAIHYFRVVPEYWQDRLEKLKNLGCNTVETYIPWNLHEPRKGTFCFEGLADVVRAGFDLPFEEAVKTERTRFLALVDDPRSKALRYAFFAERETARAPGLSTGRWTGLCWSQAGPT